MSRAQRDVMHLFEAQCGAVSGPFERNPAVPRPLEDPAARVPGGERDRSPLVDLCCPHTAGAENLVSLRSAAWPLLRWRVLTLRRELTAGRRELAAERDDSMVINQNRGR
jgi:hypothetical protein